MQQLGNSWGRLCPVARSIGHYQVRFAGTRAWRRRRGISRGDPLRQSFPTFEFSDVVLDLDAESSPYARPVNEEDWQREIEKYAVNPAVESAAQRITDLREENRKAHDLMLQNSVKNRFGVWQVSDMDILSVALQGVPRKRSSSDATLIYGNKVRTDMLSQALQLNGITDRITSQDDAKVIHFMAHRQALARSTDPSRAGNEAETTSAGAEDIKSLDASLRYHSNFRKMQRLVSRFAQTDHGCRLLSQCGTTISDLCLKSQESGKFTSDDVLIFLNNLTSNLQARKVNVGEALCVAGLRAASAAGQPAAGARYINIMHNMGYSLSADDVQGTLDAFLAASLRSNTGTHGPASQADLPSEILILLTGRSLTGYVPQTSLRATIRATAEFGPAYSSYVVLLGELGALRMLWHEWNNWPGLKGGLSPQRKVPLFTDALVQYATSLKRRGASFDQECYKTVTGDIVQDAALDLNCIRKQTSHIVGNMRAPGIPSDSLNAGSLSELLRGQVKPAFLKSVANSSMIGITELISAAVAGKQHGQQ